MREGEGEREREREREFSKKIKENFLFLQTLFMKNREIN